MSGRIVCFGELLLRLSPPGRELLLQTPGLAVWVGGAEANVATALARLGHCSAMVSAVPDTPIGDAAVRALRGYGVDVGGIQLRSGRMGLYFVTQGAGMRGADVVYDRAGSVFAETPVESWPWNDLLEGASWLHLSGVTPALGPATAAAVLDAARAAAKMQVRVSFDCNYRERLWNAWEGRPRETLSELVALADVLFGNHRDMALLLDRRFSGEGPDRRREAAEAAFEAFPNLRLVASTARYVDDADRHRIAARLDTPDRGFQSGEVVLAGIVDRIGGGDAFAAGVLHGLAEQQALEDVARTSLALACLKHSLPGDASLFGRGDIERFLDGGLDVRR